MQAMAHQQYLSLLLNVAAGKVGQYHLVTADGMTVSQAITYVADLLEAGTASDYELAKDIAEQVNENHQIAEGTIPTTTPFIAYAKPNGSRSGLSLHMRPNPAAEMVEISYSIPVSESRVMVEVFDLAGRRIRTLVDGQQQSGNHRVIWEGDDDRGNPVAPGMYFCRLAVDGDASTEKVMMLK